MHPLAYKIWNRLDKNVKMCAYEMENYVLDKKNGKLIPDPNGKTGLKYLKEVAYDDLMASSKESQKNYEERAKKLIDKYGSKAV